MGRHGFPPESTALKILKNNPGRRSLRRQDVKVPVELPEPTELVDAEALKEWCRAVPILQAAGLATSADFAALVCYCTVWSHWRQVSRARALEGFVTQRKASPALNPLFKAEMALLTQLRAFLVELGMTPSSRSRIKVEPPPIKSAIDRFREKHDR